MVILMLYAGMLQGGVPALEGLLVTFLLIAVSFVANTLAGVIALQMLRKKRYENETSFHQKVFPLYRISIIAQFLHKITT